jgi:hypothetical protein
MGHLEGLDRGFGELEIAGYVDYAETDRLRDFHLRAQWLRD